jgi:hypothetical protein
MALKRGGEHFAAHEKSAGLRERGACFIDDAVDRVRGGDAAMRSMLPQMSGSSSSIAAMPTMTARPAGFTPRPA